MKFILIFCSMAYGVGANCLQPTRYETKGICEFVLKHQILALKAASNRPYTNVSGRCIQI